MQSDPQVIVPRRGMYILAHKDANSYPDAWHLLRIERINEYGIEASLIDDYGQDGSGNGLVPVMTVPFADIKAIGEQVSMVPR